MTSPTQNKKPTKARAKFKIIQKIIKTVTMATQRKKLSPSRKPQQKTVTMAGLYDLQETLGKGHYAIVKAARHVFTGERVAVKVIDKSKLDEPSQKSLLKEVLCMKLVQHPNVVRLYEVIDTSTKLFLVLELGHGDLYDLITRGGPLDEPTARYYFTQIVAAVSYCHKLHVVHRDLKPENVVFFPNSHLSNGLVKLTDFGFSNKFCPGVKLDTSCGSLAYSAPEILLGDSYDPPAVDIWSLGVILYMLLVGSPPFQEANDSETLTMIMDVKYSIPTSVSKQGKDLIQHMLQKLPENRARLPFIEAHPWMEQKQTRLNPLVSIEKLTQEDRNGIIQQMISGNIVSNYNIVVDSLEKDAYNYITSTFYLLAEKLLRERGVDLIEDEEDEVMTTGSLESLGPGSSNTRRRKSSLLLEKSLTEEMESLDLDKYTNSKRLSSISCSTGLAELNKQLSLHQEEDEEEDADDEDTIQPSMKHISRRHQNYHRRKSPQPSTSRLIRSISSTSSDDESTSKPILQKTCKISKISRDSSTSSSSTNQATPTQQNQNQPQNINTEVAMVIEQQTKEVEKETKTKKKSSKLLKWLKNLKFKSNDTENNNKIYKTKSCSELKIKFVK